MKENSVKNTMLQDGIDFNISVKNHSFLHKIKLRKTNRTFVIFPICLGSLLEISELINKMDNVEPETEEQKDNFIDYAIAKIVKNSRKFAEIIAIAIRNKPFSDNSLIRYFQKLNLKRLVKFINSNVDNHEAMTLFQVVIDQMGIQHFLASMVLIKGMDRNTKIETEKKPTIGD